MKNANISRLGGFTLIELLVVVLIIGILAGVALPEYRKAVIRSRMTEAVTLMDSIVKAQRRKLMQTNRYAETFEGLDVTPKGASGQSFRTNPDGENGFSFILHDDGVEAQAVMAGIYFELYRYYQSDKTSCVGAEDARGLCADFCGVDSLPPGGGYCCNDGTPSNCPRPTNN